MHLKKITSNIELPALAKEGFGRGSYIGVNDMKWLTLTEIGRRARSKKGALEVSYEHWNQLYNATAKELRKAIKERKVDIENDHCGLCRYYNVRCFRCPLGASNGSCYASSGTLYAEVRDEFFYNDIQNWWAWKRAAKALRDKLKKLMESV